MLGLLSLSTRMIVFQDLIPRPISSGWLSWSRTLDDGRDFEDTFYASLPLLCCTFMYFYPGPTGCTGRAASCTFECNISLCSLMFNDAWTVASSSASYTWPWNGRRTSHFTLDLDRSCTACFKSILFDTCPIISKVELRSERFPCGSIRDLIQQRRMNISVTLVHTLIGKCLAKIESGSWHLTSVWMCVCACVCISVEHWRKKPFWPHHGSSRLFHWVQPCFCGLLHTSSSGPLGYKKNC